jgi:hypothetical protein
MGWSSVVSGKDASLTPRTPMVLGTFLVLAAAAAFYFALVPQSGWLPASESDMAVRPVQPMSSVPAPVPVSPSTVGASAAAPPPVPSVPPELPASPPAATPASIEAEIALSEYAEVLALVKRLFAAEYDELMLAAAQRRNEGVSDEVFGRELATGLQKIMRGKLTYGTGASTSMMDRLAANEASLFHALGTDGAAFCHMMLGMDDSPPAGPPPGSVRQLLQLGTLYRFQAIAEGMPDAKPAVPLSKEELRAFETSVVQVGLNFNDVNSGAFLKAGGGPGKPCLTLETLHLAIAKLAEGTRRKIYAGMFFLGRGQ